MIVKVKKTDENTKLPKQATEGDFCYDVWAVSEEEIAPNVWRYGLGFKYEIIREDLNPDFNISLDLRPRSSIWKTGMVLANSTCTCDEFYRGEVKAIFYHVMPDMPRYKVGDKILQAKIGISPKAYFVFVDNINEDTERGVGGFGSSGIK